VVAVASARPYASRLHLAADRQPHQHLITLPAAQKQRQIMKQYFNKANQNNLSNN